MIEQLRNRRSVRLYTDEPVEQEKVEVLREAALRSPTSRNKMAWKFWFIQDREILKKLARSKSSGSIPVGRAPLGVVVGADSSLTDVWVEDCSIASIIIQLTAQSLGLGSCWIQIRNRERKGGESSESYVKDLIGSDSDDIRIESIISIGYSKENKSPVEREDLPDNAVYFI